MLTDSEIREAMEQQALQIKPFEPKRLEPASYDLRAGRVLVARRGIVDLSKEPLVLRHGDWAEIESLEVVELPLNMAATVGVRSSLTRRGLDWFSGPQIDPGYKGKIYISVFNASVAPIDISYGMAFATLIFYRLSRDASRPYAGKFQKQLTFPEEDVERMMKTESYTFSDVVASVASLDQTVDKLTKASERTVTDLGWVRKLLVAILLAIVAGVAAQIIGYWIK
jgi:dCTP deaminase